MLRNKAIVAFFVAIFVLSAVLGGFWSSSPVSASTKEVILATTTSTQDSGLLDVLIPVFEKASGYRMKTIAVGTGQALAMGERGEADVLLVHAPDSEIPLVEKGVCINRQLVMHNDFVVVGPASDPANIKGLKSVTEGFRRIAAGQYLFISRGDNSGTHKMEEKIWQTAKITPAGSWYQQAGAGMGQTLNIASYKQGYTLTDRATYLAQRKNLESVILLEGDSALLNIYHVMQVNPNRFSLVNGPGGKAFVDFLVSRQAQDLISVFGVKAFGQPLFFPDAGKKVEDLGK